MSSSIQGVISGSLLSNLTLFNKHKLQQASNRQANRGHTKQPMQTFGING
jgi:hypothetical protein